MKPDNPRGSAATDEPPPACEDHGTPLLDRRKVDAWVTLLGWVDADIAHACERQMGVHRAV